MAWRSAGDTALARANRLIRRMSEDVDFKVVPQPAAPALAPDRTALPRPVRHQTSAEIKNSGEKVPVWRAAKGSSFVTKSLVRHGLA